MPWVLHWNLQGTSKVTKCPLVATPEFQIPGNSQHQEAVECYIWKYGESPKPGDQIEVIVRYQRIRNHKEPEWCLFNKEQWLTFLGAIVLRQLSLSQSRLSGAPATKSSGLRQREQSNSEPRSNEPWPSCRNGFVWTGVPCQQLEKMSALPVLRYYSEEEEEEPGPQEAGRADVIGS